MLRKALYGLKQAPRAWYGTLRGFLFERGFEMGKVNQTLVPLQGFPPIATNPLGNTTISVAIGGTIAPKR
jgi:hypothetical protein